MLVVKKVLRERYIILTDMFLVQLVRTLSNRLGVMLVVPLGAKPGGGARKMLVLLFMGRVELF